MQTASKESLIKLLTAALDGHHRLGKRGPGFLDGIKQVRDLFDREFHRDVPADKLLEFCVGLICSIQPEEPRRNRYLPELEQGILASAYFLYTAIRPIEYHGAIND